MREFTVQFDSASVEMMKRIQAQSEAFSISAHGVVESLTASALQMQAQIEAWGKRWRQWSQSLLDGLERSDQRLEPQARQLGELGWTVPLWASPDLVPVLLEHVDENDLDSVFVSLYTRRRRQNFIQMFRGLETSPVLGQWKPLLRDCRWAYYRGRHRLVVPSLLSTLEGLLAVAGQAWSGRHSPRATARRMSAQRIRFRQSLWASVDSFVAQVFQTWDFSQPPPGSINRHWILHGRAVPDWTQADSLRLFQAIDTLSQIADATGRLQDA